MTRKTSHFPQAVLLTALMLISAIPARAETPDRLPLSFELNEGQASPQIKAIARGSGYGIMLTSDEMVLALTRGVKSDGDVLRLRLIGGSRTPAISGIDRLPGTVSYYVGNDSTKWRSGIATYAKVKYASVYRGIDLIYYGNQRQLEYDFVVAPGANPSAIQLSVAGAKKMRIQDNGDLFMETSHGIVVQPKPVLYQVIDGQRQTVEGGFALAGSNRMSFNIGSYDRDHELIIDPSIGFYTYFGDTGTDQIKSIAVTSPSGFTFYGGLTTSLTLPNAGNTYGGGGADGFISAIGPNAASVLLTLFLGGTGTDAVNGLALASGLAPAFLAVTGLTNSTDFPLQNAAQPTLGGSFDSFVTKFNISIVGGVPSAIMGFSTYAGGTNIDQGNGIAVSNLATGSAIFVTGSTLSTDFPVANAYQGTKGGGYDAFISKYTSIGTVSYSTYLGWGASEQGMGIAVYNQSTPVVEALPVVAATMGLPTGRSLALAVSLNGTGSALRYARAFGGLTATTVANAVAVDSTGGAYIAGGTNDPAFPVLNAVQATYGGNHDAIVVALDPSGNPVFSSYYGGLGYDRAFGITVDTFTGGDNDIIIGGLTTGSFPATAVQTTYGGGSADGFVVLLNGPGPLYTLGYATYLGGTGVDVVYSVCVGSAHSARVAGITNSPGLATAGVAGPNLAGGYDGFIARIAP